MPAQDLQSGAETVLWPRGDLRSLTRDKPRGLSMALAFFAALALHACFLAWALVSRPEALGRDTGESEGVAVEILDAAAFDLKYPSLIAGKAVAPSAERPAAAAVPEASAQTQPVAASEPAPVPSTPVTDEITDQLATPLQAPKDPLDLKLDTAALAAKPQQRPMTAAEQVARQLGGSARARAGEIDEFTRAVIAMLEGSKPVSNGITGEVVAGFVVSAAGELQNLALVRSSGVPKLDRLVLTALTGLRVKVPPATAELRERTFEITYDYQ